MHFNALLCYSVQCSLNHIFSGIALLCLEIHFVIASLALHCPLHYGCTPNDTKLFFLAKSCEIFNQRKHEDIHEQQDGLHCFALLCFALHCIAFSIALHWMVCIALNWAVCNALLCFPLLCIGRFALLCIGQFAMLCFAKVGLSFAAVTKREVSTVWCSCVQLCVLVVLL